MNRLFVFGNGASIAEGAPSWENLIPSIIKLKRDEIIELGTNRGLSSTDSKKLGDIFNEKHDNFKAFLDLFYPNHVPNPPSFHDIYPFLHLLYENEEELKYRKTKLTRSNIHNLLLDIIWLLSVILEIKLLKSKSLHTKFIYLLTEHLDRAKFLKCSFLNLNYDILLDNALVEIQKKFGEESKNQIDLDYHLDFTNYITRYGNWKRPGKNKSISLLKLHGSLNWIHCPICCQITLTPQVKGVTLSILPKMYECICKEEIKQSLLVPPTHERMLKTNKIPNLWNIAENKIREARIIYFIGYSLSEYDLYFRKLLKKFALQKEDKIIYLICRSPNSEEEKEDKNETTLRYRRYFSNELIDSQLSFASFVDRLEFLLLCKNKGFIKETTKIEFLFSKPLLELIPIDSFFVIVKEILSEKDIKTLNIIFKNPERISIKEIIAISKIEESEIYDSISRLLNFSLIVKDSRDKQLKRLCEKTTYYTNRSLRDKIEQVLLS